MSEELESSSSETNESSEADATDTESNEEFYVAEGFVNAYQDEPLAEQGENERRAEEVDEDGLRPATLDARLEGRSPLNEW